MSFNDGNIAEFRASGGQIGLFGDAPVLLLTSIGAKSGARRTSPMIYLADQDDSELIYVFASAAGADTNPAWYYNLLSHPDQVTVEMALTPSLRRRAYCRRSIAPRSTQSRPIATRASRSTKPRPSGEFRSLLSSYKSRVNRWLTASNRLPRPADAFHNYTCMSSALQASVVGVGSRNLPVQHAVGLIFQHAIARNGVEDAQFAATLSTSHL